jgi:hypothetical protein
MADLMQKEDVGLSLASLLGGVIHPFREQWIRYETALLQALQRSEQLRLENALLREELAKYEPSSAQGASR